MISLEADALGMKRPQDKDSSLLPIHKRIRFTSLDRNPYKERGHEASRLDSCQPKRDSDQQDDGELSCDRDLDCMPTDSGTFVSNGTLENSINFVAASYLTLDDEMFVLRKRKAVKNLSNEHSLRRERVIGLPTASRGPQDSRHDTPLGFSNIDGVSCYRNAVLQTLLHSAHFINYMQSRQYSSSRCRHATNAACLFCSLSKVITASIGRRKRNMSSDLAGLKDTIRRIGLSPASPGSSLKLWQQHPWMRRNLQADAHEMLYFLINRLLVYSNTPQPVVEGLFKLTIVQQWQCEDCEQYSNPVVQDETGLQIPIQQKHISLAQYIDEYFAPQILSIRCDNCQTTRKRTRRVRVSAAPSVLFIQLMRFMTTALGNRKDSKEIQIPKSLNLEKHAENIEFRNTTSLQYQIKSVISHQGSLNGGHYISCGYDHLGTVREYDDETVTKTTFREMVRPGDASKMRGKFTPYILMYESCGMTAAV